LLVDDRDEQCSQRRLPLDIPRRLLCRAKRVIHSFSDTTIRLLTRLLQQAADVVLRLGVNLVEERLTPPEFYRNPPCPLKWKRSYSQAEKVQLLSHQVELLG